MRHGKDHRRVGKHCACDVEEHQKSAPVQHSDADDANPETDVGRQENTRANIIFFSSPFARRTISSNMAAEKIVSYSTPEILPFFSLLSSLSLISQRYFSSDIRRKLTRRSPQEIQITWIPYSMENTPPIPAPMAKARITPK